ncbi:MAG: hypothetical protein PHW84_01940 [Methanosarcina sp.]|nr:hypothetical protein [Methanosarcina sp.]
MDEKAREDMIIGVSDCLEANHCAIKRDDLFNKFKNTSRDDMKSIIEAMKRRKMLWYEEHTDKYRLIIK